MNAHMQPESGHQPGHIEIMEYRPTAAALGMLRETCTTLPDLATPEGLAAAKEARATLRSYRKRLEHCRRDLKAPLVARGQLIDSEAERIKGELLAIEHPIDEAIRAEEQRQAAEKAAQKRAEAERRAALEARVNDIRTRVLAVANQDAAAIRAALEHAHAFEPNPDEFDEYWPAAMKAVTEVRQALETLLAQREALEARQAEDEARLQAQREELARQHAEIERQRAQEEAQGRAEREELARWRAEDTARRQNERATREGRRADAAAETPADPTPASVVDVAPALDETRKPASVKPHKAKAEPLAAIKTALAAGTLTGEEAIDRAYQIGFEAGERAARRAA